MAPSGHLEEPMLAPQQPPRTRLKFGVTRTLAVLLSVSMAGMLPRGQAARIRHVEVSQANEASLGSRFGGDGDGFGAGFGGNGGGFPRGGGFPVGGGGFPDGGGGFPYVGGGFPDGGGGFPDVGGGFPNGGGGFPHGDGEFPNFPNGNAGFPSGHEGFPSGPAGFGGMGAQIFACANKLGNRCCADQAFRTNVCIPLHWCSIAIGTKSAGSFPHSCPTGDTSRCNQDVPTLEQQARSVLADCETKLNGLYDLARTLAQCAHDVATCKADATAQVAVAHRTQSQSNRCKASKGEESSRQHLDDKLKAGFCANHAAELQVSLITLSSAQAKCLEAKMPQIPIPQIHIDVPEVHLSGGINVSSPTFNANDIEVPNLSGGGSVGDISIPGGGAGRLDVACQDKPITLEQRKAHVMADTKTCQDSKSRCTSAQRQLQDTNTKLDADKAMNCGQQTTSSSSSLVELAEGIHPFIESYVQVLQAMKLNYFFKDCGDVSTSIDAAMLIAEKCAE